MKVTAETVYVAMSGHISREVIRALHKHGPCTLIKVAETTGYTRLQVVNAIQRLKRVRVVDIHSAAHGAGQPATYVLRRTSFEAAIDELGEIGSLSLPPDVEHRGSGGIGTRWADDLR